MASISPGDPVFLYNSKPSTKFEVFGYLGMYHIIWGKSKSAEIIIYTQKKIIQTKIIIICLIQCTFLSGIAFGSGGLFTF